MFKLIKLGFYVLIGYALYELYQGIQSGEFSGAAGGGQRRSQGQSGPGRMTGRGQGRHEVSAESSGTSAPHTVGRGVVR